MILAAGFGSRLGSLSDQRPKPMLPVGNTPLIGWAVRWLRHHGVQEIVINLHHKGELIEAELGDGSALGVRISYSREAEILGTGGGLRQARPLLDDGSGAPIVVLNGKLLFELDLAELLTFHRQQQAEATLVLRHDAEQIWGAGFGLDNAGKVVRFLDRDRPGTAVTRPDFMFTGIHVLSPTFFDRIPQHGAPCVIRTAYRDLFQTGGELFGFEHSGYWWEHSTVERYLKGVAKVLDGRIALPFADGPLRGVDPTADVHTSARVDERAWIGPRARVDADVVIGPHVQIGADAHVLAHASLQRCVVWPGVTVSGSHRDAVLTPAAPGVTT